MIMRTPPLLLWLLPLLLSASSCSADIFRDISCTVSFSLAGFELGAYDRYPEWFNDDSVMQLGQAGSYFGAEDIEEYARFAGRAPESFFVDFLNIDAQLKLVTGRDPQTGECVYLVSSISNYRMDPTTAKPGVFALQVGAKVYFEPTSFSTIAIRRINIYYSDDWLFYFFGVASNEDKSRQHICEIMENNCPDTWLLNGFTTTSECMAAMRALVPVGPNNDVSGNSLGCRMLHGKFAAVNSKHCPHISLIPQIDVNGQFKCQDPGEFEPPTNLFTQDEIDFISNRSKELGFSQDGFNPCNDCNGPQGGNKAKFFNTYWRSFQNINPIPANWYWWKWIEPPLCTQCVEQNGDPNANPWKPANPAD